MAPVERPMTSAGRQTPCTAEAKKPQKIDGFAFAGASISRFKGKIFFRLFSSGPPAPNSRAVIGAPAGQFKRRLIDSEAIHPRMLKFIRSARR
jgi:hypothetical protein